MDQKRMNMSLMNDVKHITNHFYGTADHKDGQACHDR